MHSANDTFHGMKIISDYDCLAVKGHYVLEVNSSNTLVCRYYDNNGLEDDDPYEFNLYDFGINPSESNITGSIKRKLERGSLLISENAVDFIKDLASC